MGTGRTLLDQIEDAALDEKSSLASALRKCVSLGGQAGSERLREWATRELTGYTSSIKDMPDFRRVFAPIVIDGFSGNYHVTGQQVSIVDLPEVAREAEISEDLPLAAGVGELEAMIAAAQVSGDTVKLSLPGGAMLAKLMTAEMQNSYRAVERIYWSVSPVAIAGVVDQIRTRLVALVAEVRAAAADPKAPSTEAVDNAVNVAIYGKARDVTVYASQGRNNLISHGEPSPDRPWYRRVKVLASMVVGAATIAATVIAWVQWK